jgi:hypothetical protein
MGKFTTRSPTSLCSVFTFCSCNDGIFEILWRVYPE